jgi:hypothetical protein
VSVIVYILYVLTFYYIEQVQGGTQCGRVLVRHFGLRSK